MSRTSTLTNPVPVWVLWKDASGSASWVDLDSLEELSVAANIQSCGFLVKETKDGVYLAVGVSANKEGHDAVANPFFIPRGMILKMKKLKV